MNSRLIINADDFGLTGGVNRAVAELFTAGSLTSTTLMAGSKAVLDAAAISSILPELGVGCHVVLVDGQPMAEPDRISSLLGPDENSFRRSLSAFACAALLGQLDETEIEREAAAQVGRLFDLGITPTHLDTHKHTHMFPAVLRPLLRVAERFGIRAIRNPFEQAWSLQIGHIRQARKLQVRMLGFLEGIFRKQVDAYEGRIRTTDGIIGVAATGELDATLLAALLEAVPAGTWEFVCHPGLSDAELAMVPTRLRHQREIEREALLQVVQEVTAEMEIELVSFRALHSPWTDAQLTS